MSAFLYCANGGHVKNSKCQHSLLLKSICLFVLCGCSNHAVPMIDSLPVLRVEEWPLPGESLTSDTVRLLIDRVCVFASNAFVCFPCSFFNIINSVQQVFIYLFLPDLLGC